jgi:hypothetical protein
VFTFVPGLVPTPPYPTWARELQVLREVGALIRGFHEAMSGFDPGEEWTHDLADPRGAPLWCHNDVCPENVVFRKGRAVGLLDFDTVAQGRAAWDLARAARMWVPMAVPGSSRSWGDVGDPWARLGTLVRGYGLAAEDAQMFAEVLLDATRQGQDWVRARVSLGEPAFVEMWETFGLAERFDADLAWVSQNTSRITRTVSSA